MGYPKDLDDCQYEIGVWGDATFPRSTPKSVVAHLRREMQELVEETDPVKRRDECADVLMLICQLAHKEGWSLQSALRDKFAINQRREWGEPDDEGVVSHIREGGENS